MQESGSGMGGVAVGTANRFDPLGWFVDRRLAAIRQHRLPVTLELWDGRRIPLGETSEVTLRLREPAALRDLASPGLDRLGEAYVAGRIDFDGDIRDVLRIAIRLSGECHDRRSAGLRPRRLARRTRQSDAEAIGHHYDVSNAFYERFLDERMVYSCAYFRREDASLGQAQFDKLEHVCRKLDLRPGMRLLDIGCGWGALAIHAARRFGVTVVGITLSREQHAYALEKVERAGLADRVEIRLQDYRDLPPADRFDRVASIGMFEHVGLENLADYFARVRQALVPGGIALNHGITTSDAGGRRVGHGAGRFIERHVFPNGALPHVSGAVAELSRAGLELLDAESLRRHYAKTLWCWSDRFERDLRRLQSIAGERRTRVWRAYLAGCAIGFERGWVNVYQLLVARPEEGVQAGHIDTPMTREHVYVR